MMGTKQSKTKLNFQQYNIEINIPADKMEIVWAKMDKRLPVAPWTAEASFERRAQSTPVEFVTLLNQETSCWRIVLNISFRKRNVKFSELMPNRYI